MKKLKNKQISDSGFIIIFTLIALGAMMLIGFAFVAETSLARKASASYAQPQITNELSKGLILNISNNLQDQLENNDPGTSVPSSGDTGTKPINNPEAHSMFHRTILDPGSGTRGYFDIRTSVLTNASSNTTVGRQAGEAIEFYLGEENNSTDKGHLSNVYYYAGYIQNDGSASNARTPEFDGIDINNDGDYEFRYTYMVMSQTGKIDPNFAINTQADETDAYERYSDRLNNTNTIIDLEKYPTYSELTLAGTLDTTVNTDILSDLKSLKPAIGWTSFPYLSQELDLPDGATNLTDASAYKNYYALYPHSIEEALPEIDLKSRYDLSFIDNNTTFSSYLIDSDGDSTPDSGSIHDAIDDSGISAGSTTSGEGMSSKNQLAANILDYCDPDHSPRTDATYGVGDYSVPGYIGFENIAMTEVYIDWTAAPTNDIDGDGVNEAYLSGLMDINTTSYIEIYSPDVDLDPATGSASVRALYYFDSRQNKTTGDNSTDTDNNAIIFDTLTVGTGGYYYLSPSTTTTIPIGGRSGNNGQYRCVTVNHKVAVEIDDSGSYKALDVAHLHNSSWRWRANDIRNCYHRWQAKDPVVHKSPTHWEHDGSITGNLVDLTIPTSPIWPSSKGAPSTITNQNSGYSDKENNYTTEWDQLSTGFFRNDYPQSLVELGSIRTGNPWQTLDLVAEPTSSHQGHYALLNLLRLGDGKGAETAGTLPEIRNRRLNANSRFAHVLKAAFNGIGSSNNSPETIPTASTVIDDAKITALVNNFPGVSNGSHDSNFSEDDDSDDFATSNDSFGVTISDARSIFGRAIASGSSVPDRNPIHYRKPFRDSRGTGTSDLTDHEAERLFWLSKDLMGGMTYFSVFYSIQPGKGLASKTYPLYYGTGSNHGFTPKSDFSTYRAEIAYGLDPDDPANRTNKKIKVLSIRKTK